MEKDKLCVKMQATLGTLIAFGNLVPLLSIVLPLVGYLLRPILNHASVFVLLGAISLQLFYVSQSVPQCSDVVGAIDAMGNSTLPRTGEWNALEHFKTQVWPCVSSTLLIACAKAFTTLFKIAAAIKNAL